MKSAVALTVMVSGAVAKVDYSCLHRCVVVGDVCC